MMKMTELVIDYLFVIEKPKDAILSTIRNQEKVIYLNDFDSYLLRNLLFFNFNKFYNLN